MVRTVVLLFMDASDGDDGGRRAKIRVKVALVETDRHTDKFADGQAHRLRGRQTYRERD